MRNTSFSVLALAIALAVMSAGAAYAEDDKLTGLDRARQASMRAIDRAEGRMVEARGGELPPGLAKQVDKLTGRERAAQAITAAMERGNGNGNAFGRGHSLQVLTMLVNGESPDALEDAPNHGANVNAMVKAYNQLKKQQRDAG